MAAIRNVGVVTMLAYVSALSVDAQESPEVKTTFGRRQVEQMLDDRPDMQGILPASHPLYEWVASGFNGDRFGRRVYWLAVSPQDGYPSVFIPPYGEIPPFIQLTAGTELTPVDRWASVIFELHNLEGFDKADKLVEQAMRGKLTGEQYALACVRLEYQASLRTKQQLLKHPIPKATDKKNPVYQQILALKPTFEEHQADLAAKGQPLGNYDYFLDHYQRVLAPAMHANDRNDKASTP